MSIFDDLINPYSKHSEQEWDRIIWDEFLKIKRDHFNFDRYTWWAYYSAVGDITETISQPKMPAKFRSKTGFKKWMKTQRVINEDIIACFNDACSTVFHNYGVLFKPHFKRDKQGMISKLIFISVL